MSSDENGDTMAIRAEQIELVGNYARAISRHSDEIHEIFEDTFGSDRLHNNYDDYVNTMNSFLYDVVDEGDEGDVSLALVNLVSNHSPELYGDVKEQDDSLAEFIKSLANNFGLAVQRRVRRVRQGQDYWSNIQSELKVRSDRPAYTHEVLIDYKERIRFDSGLAQTGILARHFTEQLANAPDVMGEDVIAFMDQSEIERIQELSEILLERIEDYDLEGFEGFETTVEEAPDEQEEGQSNPDDRTTGE